jgi:hypothetical protein
MKAIPGSRCWIGFLFEVLDCQKNSSVYTEPPTDSGYIDPIINRLHLAHINEVEGLRIPDAEQQFYVLDPADARMRARDPLASDAALLFSQFFSRLSDPKDREMLRECFVETTETSPLWDQAYVSRGPRRRL